MRRHNIYLKNAIETSGKHLADISVVLILLHFVLFSTKTMFELSLGISKFTNFLELGHLAAIFVVCIAYLIETVFKNGLDQRLMEIRVSGDHSTFLSLDQIIMVSDLKTTSMMICGLYYPFRLIQCLAHFE